MEYEILTVKFIIFNVCSLSCFIIFVRKKKLIVCLTRCVKVKITNQLIYQYFEMSNLVLMYILNSFPGDPLVPCRLASALFSSINLLLYECKFGSINFKMNFLLSQNNKRKCYSKLMKLFGNFLLPPYYSNSTCSTILFQFSLSRK